MGKKKVKYGAPSEKGDITLQKLLEVYYNSRHIDNPEAFLTFYLRLPSGHTIDLSNKIRMGEFGVVPELTIEFEIAEHYEKLIKALTKIEKEIEEELYL